ncbi:hypothetical protein ASF53_20975 [Methylobacterium sp. Leaf123]|uniref:hypothetical protein n=1 Tax=Methylobacterium sp. Leaf123 TaxID=1736264 RepID=UPI0006F512FF|nr:hypothetical protein [Methylobacterium sp. Leaf123]KQQ26409.1 hypothetical protein ASF53_20975 [Methylobacterium sp. Leaf123]
MSWPAALLWVLIFAAAVSNGPGLLYLLMVCGAFGSLQMLPGSGGANLLPQSACAAVFVCKVLIQRGNVLRGVEAALDPQRLALFSAFLVYALFGAVVLPRVFSGMIEVVPVSAFRFGTDILKPGAGNITQSGYMMLSYATALAFTVIGQTETTRAHYRRALLCGAYALIATGLIDLITFSLNLGAVLEPFRTATYALLTDVEAEGAKRVVGLMPEASSYGTACVGLAAALLFTRPLYRPGTELRLVMVAIGALVLMTMLSTSSTAYVGLAVFGLVYGCDLLVRMLDAGNPRRDGIGLEVGLIVLAVFAVFATFVIKPTLFDPVVAMVDKMVFQKSSSASYVERSLWNRVGWHAFLDSGGLGVGLGSIRVSNWAISILGSTGLFGALLMFGFIAQQLVSAPRGASRKAVLFATVTKLALLPVLVMYQLSGTIPDIGIAASAALGMIAATHARPGGQRTMPLRSLAGRPASVGGPSEFQT